MQLIPDRLQRYIKFARFLMKYWNSDVVTHAAEQASVTDTTTEAGEPEAGYGKPEELVEDLKAMGPTWVKLGQLLSTRPDLLPDEYLAALTSLQDDVNEVPFEEIGPIIEAELGVRISKAFESFSEKPLASASIGQVHTAVLRSGREVVVKVQRPDVRKKIVDDLDMLAEATALLVKYRKAARKYAVDETFDELRHILLNELDYHKEAQNLIILSENLKDYPDIIVPQPIPDYCSSKVLTMEYIKGQKITATSPVIRTEENFTPLIDSLVECYLKQIVVDGFAHADPHPGNVQLTADHKIVLMDLGMVAKFSKTTQDKLLKLLIAISNRDGDAVSDILLAFSDHGEGTDLQHFRATINRLVLDNQKYAARQMQTGKFLIEINRLAAAENIKIHAELNIVGKILGNLDQIVAALTPDFDIQESIRKHLEKLFKRKMLHDIMPENMLGALVELKNLGKNLPGRINTIVERIANNELEIKIDAIDEKRFTDGFQKVANRITLGLIIAAMIIGASMLMRVPSAFTIFGYPGLAMIFFIAAAVAGFALIYIITFKDESFKKDVNSDSSL